MENLVRAQFKLRDFYRGIFSGRASDVVKVNEAASQKLDSRYLKARVASRLYFCLEGVETLRAFFACPFDYDCGLDVVAGVYEKALE